MRNVHLPAVLDKVLGSANCFYTIDEDNEVFITKGFALATELPYGFFNGEKDTRKMVAKNDSGATVYMNHQKTATQDILVENKLYDIGIKRNEAPTGKLNIAGYIRQLRTGESISGALIYIDHPHIQVNSDQFGYYSMTLPAGRHTLNIIAPGMFDAKRQVMLYSDGKFDITMNEKILTKGSSC